MAKLFTFRWQFTLNENSLIQPFHIAMTRQDFEDFEKNAVSNFEEIEKNFK